MNGDGARGEAQGVSGGVVQWWKEGSFIKICLVSYRALF